MGKIVAAQAEKEAFDGTWLLAEPELKPLHYLGFNYYAVLSERLEARVPNATEEGPMAEQIEQGTQDAAGEARERREREGRDKE